MASVAAAICVNTTVKTAATIHIPQTIPHTPLIRNPHHHNTHFYTHIHNFLLVREVLVREVLVREVLVRVVLVREVLVGEVLVREVFLVWVVLVQA
jgi:hypothetical protein